MKFVIAAAILQPGLALAVVGSHNADMQGDPISGPVSLLGLLIVGALFWYFSRK